MSASQIKTLSFDSVSALGRFARDTPRSDKCPAASGRDKEHSWDNGMDLEEAIATGCKGGYWKEGADMMRDSLKITEELAELKPLPTMQTSPDGFMPCVPHALMNLPNTMFKRPKLDSLDKPVLRIGVQMGIYWGVSAEQQIRKGAAILSVIDQLESVGYRCELVAIWRASEDNTNSFKKWVNMECTLKQADDHWNPVSAAFMIAHPAAQRRLVWKACEAVPEYSASLRYGYCTNENTSKLAESMASDFDVWFPCVESTIEKHLETEEKAFDWVQSEVSKQLAMMDDETH